MKKLVGLLLGLWIVGCGKEGITVSGDSEAALADRRVFGTWTGLQDVSVTGQNYHFEFTVGPQSFTNITTCTYSDGTVLTSQVTSRARITKDKIQVLDKVEHTETQGDKKCNAQLSPFESSYAVEGENLRFQHGAEMLLLTRKTQ